MSEFNIKKFIAGAPTKVLGHRGYDNAKFEGFLCSSVYKGEVHYYTIDSDGVGKKAILAPIRMLDARFGLEHLGVVDDVAPAKPPIVEIVRHFRQRDNETLSTSTVGGMTAVCVLNYDTLTMCVFPAFCSAEENFEKASGLVIAKQRQRRNIGIKFAFDRNLSIKENLKIALEEQLVCEGARIFPTGGGTVNENANMYMSFMKCLSSSGRSLDPIL